MKGKKILLTLCAVVMCFMAALIPQGPKVEAGAFDSIYYDVTLEPGQVSSPYHPSMTDWFKSYSITDSSVCDITYTDPNLISIVAKKPGKSVVTIYGEYRDYIITVTVAEASA